MRQLSLPGKQRGVVMFVALIMMVVMLLVAVASFNMGRQNTIIAGNMQHKAEVTVNASLHIHLDEHNCLEVIVIRGRADKVHEIASKLIATKGVQNGKLVTTTPEMKH